MKKTIVLALILTACKSSPPLNAEMPPLTQPAATQPAAEACPLFCHLEAEACVRPDVTGAPGSCGAYSMQLRAGFEEKAVPCPATCCPAKAEGTDPDADGIVGTADLCPDAPEDVDGFQDQDGCADLDNDADGISDVDDRCCYVAEDRDDVEDLDGCPEP